MKWRNRENPAGKTLLQKEIAKKSSEGLKKLPTRGMSQKIGTKNDHEEHHCNMKLQSLSNY